MNIRATDDIGDWTFGNGRANYKTGLLSLLQFIAENLQTWKNDLFYNTDAGIDWVNLLGGKINDFNENVAMIEQDVRATILAQEINGVIGLENLDISYNGYTRQLTLTYVVNTVYGVSDIQTLILDFYGTGII